MHPKSSAAASKSALVDRQQPVNESATSLSALRFEAPGPRQVPYNLEAEQAVLGAILINNEAMDRVSSFLEAQHFYDPLHQKIYETCSELIAAGKLASPITLRPFFENAEPVSPMITAPQYLGKLAATATTTLYAEDYGRTILKLANRRTAIVIGEDLAEGLLANPEVPYCDLIRETQELLGEVQESTDHDGWPAPDPTILQCTQEAPPPMPLTGFGPELESYIRDAADAAGAPTDYVGLSIAIGASGVIGARRWVEIWDGWREPCILWGALVGDPSTNKSPAMDGVREALVCAEAEKVEHFREKEKKWRRASQLAKAAKKGWQKKVEAAFTNGSTVPPKPAEAVETDQPVRPRLWIANATIDKLARLLSEQPGGLFHACDELAGLIGSFDRYGGDGGDRAFWLELYGGRAYRLDRVGDGSIDVPHMAVSALGTIQPDRLYRLVLSGDNDGLACRFLYAWPAPRPKARPQRRPDIALLKRVFKPLTSLPFDEPKVLRVAKDAVETFEAWWTGSHDVDTKAATGPLAEAYGKLNGGVLRLALVFEYVKWAPNQQRDPEPRVVSAPSIDAAIAFAERWVKPMLRRVFTEASVPEPDKNARVLARYLLQEKPDSINARQLRSAKKAELPGIRNAKAMNEACNALCDAGWLRPNFTRKGYTKGRLAKTFDVNPRLASFLIDPPSVSSVSSNSAPNGATGANEETLYTNNSSLEEVAS